MRWVRWGVVVIVGGLLLIQLVPYGRDHDNPPVVAEPAWDSPQTRELAVRACYDCHSNETEWPWYSNVAPISWLVQRDVDEGREELDFSEWNLSQEGDESAETVREGSMPPSQYLLTHPEARLTDAELAALEAGLVATFGEDLDDEDDED
ncbi:MAG TPA: heme-binding domain-containing protein [Acidimicrobiia bacterium]|jgi:mono/diheme cytochrome c family protein|nr:heme-binding domain-containing protein [Acidimicrobiia bacterium]